MRAPKRSDLALESYTFVKTVLMILVIVDHSCAFWTEHWFSVITPAIKEPHLAVLSSWLGTFHTYAFTLVSGYIFKYKVEKGDYRLYIPFLRNKAKRLLVPYWFTMVIWVAPLSVLFLHLNASDVFKKYILCINPSQLWFLWMLFDVFAIMWILWKKTALKPCATMMAVASLYILGIIGDILLSNIFCIWTACKYTLCFYLGILIRENQDRKEWQFIKSIPSSILIIGDFMAFAGINYLSDQNGLKWRLLQYVLILFLNCFGAIAAVLILEKISLLVSWKESKPFSYLSRYSMSMYLFHQQLIYISIVILNGLVAPWLNATINFVFALAGSFFISSLMMKFKVTRVLIGEK